ncbi:esterase/lipase family protein [Actinomycetospora flava]|uniref:Alpha/beta fold hydrolase n=1 Tax=Actinomycetospora flava TaxID=3129232 RepID=A0ABU8LYI1_9PSEU
MGITSTVRRHLREVRSALRVVIAVLGTLLLAALHTGRTRPPEPPEPPVADARSLVVLVHGFGAGPDCWDAVAAALGGPGVAVVTHRYTWTAGVASLGAALADEVESLARRSGARSVTLVGHSLGGVIVAASLADGRLAGVVTRVVTVAAPLRGTGWARLLPVGAVRDLRPGSPVLRSLATPGVPWTALASHADVVVAPAAAALEGTEAVVVDGVGHCGLLRDAGVVTRIAGLARPARHTRPARRTRTAALALAARPVAARPALTVVA